MSGWPTGWREAILRETGVPVTQFALDVLSAWNKSTPTEPWTNNPFGLPPVAGRVPAAVNPMYGSYSGMSMMRRDLKLLLHGTNDKAVIHALISADSYAEAYRAISALGLPAARTESDYPSAVLDLVPQKYRDSLQTVAADSRKSGGPGVVPPNVLHSGLSTQQEILRARNPARSATNAVTMMLRNM